jgi:hypothetical protein
MSLGETRSRGGNAAADSLRSSVPLSRGDFGRLHSFGAGDGSARTGQTVCTELVLVGGFGLGFMGLPALSGRSFWFITQ